MRIKVLPHTVYLPRKFRDERLLDELNTYHEEIEPVFFRDGEYLTEDTCWFEVRGRAFKKRKEDFLFKLQQYNVEEIDINVINNLKAVGRINPRVLSVKQLNLIRDYNHFLWVRHSKRLSRKRLKEMKIRIKEKRNNEQDN